MERNELIAGQLLSLNKLIVEVCLAQEGRCRDCAGFGKKTLCRKLPDCGNNFFFRKLGTFEERKAIKEKRVIKDITQKS